jgi:hypothetical protein
MGRIVAFVPFVLLLFSGSTVGEGRGGLSTQDNRRQTDVRQQQDVRQVQFSSTFGQQQEELSIHDGISLSLVPESRIMGGVQVEQGAAREFQFLVGKNTTTITL